MGRVARATNAGPHKEGSQKPSEVLKPRRERNEFIYLEDFLRGTIEPGLERGKAGGRETCQDL